MRRAPPRAKPVYQTVGDIQAGRHYAQHIDQPGGPQYELTHVDEATMARQLASCEPDTARGIPASYDYVEGVIRVWPWPAEGWQVWCAASGRDVTPA